MPYKKIISNSGSYVKENSGKQVYSILTYIQEVIARITRVTEKNFIDVLVSCRKKR